MSKRVAGKQITKELYGQEEENERDKVDPVETASAEVLATRKIAMPRSRKKAEVPAESAVESANGSLGQSESSGGEAPKSTEAKANPFASIGTTPSNPFGGIKTGSAFGFGGGTNTSTSGFSFGAGEKAAAKESEQPSSTPAFSFGKGQSTQAPAAAPATSTSAFGFGAMKPLDSVAEKPANDTAEEGSSEESSEYKRLLRARSLNVAFQQAVNKILEADAFADLSVVLKEYQSHKSAESDVSIKPAEAKSDGTGLYPQFTKSDEQLEAKQSATPAFSFGASNGSSEAPKPAPAFSFKPAESTTQKSESTEVPKASAFKFQPAASTETPKKTSEGGADFTWTPDKGVKFGGAEDTAIAATSSSSFKFSNPLPSPSQMTTGNDDSSKSATSFNFSKPTTGFSFGQASEAPPASTKTPTFNFASSGSSSSLFGKTPAPSSNATPSFSFGLKAAEAPKPEAKAAATEEGDAEAEEDADAEEAPEEPRTDITQGAGEEDEEALWQEDGKIFRFVVPADAPGEGRFVDLGKCNIKLNKNKTTGKCRLIARAEGAGAIRMNARLYPHFRYTLEQKASIKVSVMNADNKTENWLVRVKEPAKAKLLIELCDEHKKS
ncbi:hypothetical protein BCR37DRAFT_378329 [Protomyces lactucae-debilis]|uniref:RanBD1 domain-containing protein n=1 Tax=Protomyces lactucae-debilis TaxID=2754530 RepID=A0A1Y2FK62_PROLT|nr:uncharacterized protein BCR37DRAFT_378329 [Protomyces lactucae-debilis]ORY84319.1 hypothetical protein BCR37DRAFT_378329 [Protomyces lactucae-debilis]